MPDQILLDKAATISDALIHLDATRRGIVLVVDDDGILFGTITDGDIRRAILRGSPLTDSVSVLIDMKASTPYQAPTTAPESATPAELTELLKRHSIRHIPIVDHQGRPVRLITSDDLLQTDRSPLSAVVMAGGFGTRLAPLTDTLPKPMLPVGDRPVLEHIVDRLREANIRSIALTTHYMAEKIEDHFGDGSDHGVAISYTKESRPLGTAGALRLLEQPTSSFVVINGDVMTDVNLAALHDFHIEHEAELTMAISRIEYSIPYGVVETNDRAQITSLTEKPSYPYFVNAGVYLCEPSVIDSIPENERFDMTDLVDLLMSQGRSVVAFPIWEHWQDIGFHTDYEDAQRYMGSEGNR